MEIEWFLSHIESFIGWINAHFITNHYWHNNHVFFKHHSLFHLLFFKPPSSTFTARLASNLKCATFLSFDISNAFFVPFLVETIHYLQTMTLFLFTFSTLSHLSKNQGGTLLQKCKKLSLWQRGCVSCYGCQEIQEKGRVKKLHSWDYTTTQQQGPFIHTTPQSPSVWKAECFRSGNVYPNIQRLGRCFNATLSQICHKEEKSDKTMRAFIPTVFLWQRSELYSQSCMKMKLKWLAPVDKPLIGEEGTDIRLHFTSKITVLYYPM